MPMLAKMLADRFQLKVHMSAKEVAGSALVAAKGDRRRRCGRLTMSNRGGFREVRGGKLGFPAVDDTGLKGLWQFKADWNVEQPLPGGDPRDEYRAAVTRHGRRSSVRGVR